jgi:hypothetical protein
LARPSEPWAARRGPLPRRFVIGLAAWLLAVAACASAAAAQMVDTLVAVVESRTVAASDIALARALGTFGFTVSAAPMGRKDIDRYVDVILVLQESERIGISVEPAETDRAWDAAVARAGGEAAVQRWLDGNAIDRDWARRAVELDVRRQKFLADRFAAFVIPSEEDITKALAPGETDEAARERARETLVRAAAEKAQAEWLDGTRRRAAIRVLIADGAVIAPPFPPP